MISCIMGRLRIVGIWGIQMMPVGFDKTLCIVLASLCSGTSVLIIGPSRSWGLVSHVGGAPG